MIEKTNLHPKNLHRFGYDFDILCQTYPALTEFVFVNKYGNKTIDFSNQKALIALNKSLLFHYYKLDFWEIPPHFLCPAIPGRLDYILNLSDLLGINENKSVRALDIGTGANLIYPILGAALLNWDFIASENNDIALENSEQIRSKNKHLGKKIQLRKQADKNQIFKGIIEKEDRFDVTMCNPPFHSSLEEANAGSKRKWNNLKKNKSVKEWFNFGGQNDELWCDGGERQYILKMIQESILFRENCRFFTTLVSKKENLEVFVVSLKSLKAKVQIIEQSQGQKQSRILVWSF
jgi:23S rRNA (adenine1618-N6)-methyltransferase